MAVEAHHLNLFPSQLIGNREIMNQIEGNTNTYNTQMGYHHHHHHGVLPLPGHTAITAETLLPAYNSLINDSVPPPKTAKKSDSGLTYNIPTTTTSFSRKRSRDSSAPINNNNNNNPFLSSYPTSTTTTTTATTQPIHYKNCGSSPFSFLGEDFSFQIQQQQFDIDRLISQHMEKVRMEIEERRKKQARKIMEAIEVGVMKRLRAKEEEIEKIGKLNWALEERVKSLCVENQIWRDLAQTNEATANALRTNLEQVLAQVKDERTRGVGLMDDDVDNENDDINGAGPLGTALADDAQSCCGENDDVVVTTGGEWRSLATERNDGRNDVVELETTSNMRCSTNNNKSSGCGGIISTSNYNNRFCRNCGREESCVLLLPCRHLCLCTVCGSSLHTCPICKSTKNASVHVNMS